MKALSFTALSIALMMPAGVSGFQTYVSQSDNEFTGPPEFVVKNWSLNEGLPQNSVNDIIQTRDGYLWIATWGGLVRFDGLKFTVFNRSTYPEMISDRVLHLFEDSASRLWIATEYGLIHKFKDKFTLHSSKNGLPNTAIDFIGEDDKGNILLVNINLELFYLNGDSWVRDENTTEVFSEKPFFQILNGVLIAVDQHHILKKTNSGWETYFTFPEPLESRVTSFLQDQAGNLWIGTNGSGLFRLTNQDFESIATPLGNLSGFISALFEDSSGNIWSLTQDGVNIFQREEHTGILTTGLWFSENRAKNIIEDNEGTIWIGTETSGLHKVRPAVFKVYDKEQGIRIDNLLSVSLTPQNSILFGTNCDGVYEYKNENIYRRPESDQLTNSCVWAVHQDEHENLWVASSGLYVFRSNGSHYRYTQNDGLSGLDIRVIYPDAENTFWIGSSEGLDYFDGQKFTSTSNQNELSDNDVRVVHRDRNNNLWVGTVNGLNKIVDGAVTTFTAIPGLASHYFRAIYEDRDGNLWFGTYGGGIVLLKDSEFTVITQEDGLFDNIVSHLVEDVNGYLWMGSNRGISRVKKSMLLDFAAGIIPTVSSTYYGAEQGLINPETNGGFQPALAQNAEGLIFFPTVAGLAVVDPADVQPNNQVPPVYIEGINMNNTSFQASDSVAANWRVDLLEIDYTALSFIDPKLINFRYKLENYDQNWVEAGNRRAAFYTGLPPGKYRFLVTASNNDGLWSDEPAVLPITIIPPFWMTRWFTIVVTFLLVMGGIALYAKRINKLKKERKQQEEISSLLIEKQEEERSRIAGEMHDSLGQLLLVIKNQALQHLKKESTDISSKQVLEDISGNVSKTLKTVREISHNLRPPELDRLGITETINALLYDLEAYADFRIEADIANIDGLIPREKEINLVRILQEALANIIKHAKASHVHVRVAVASNNIIFSIHDNGLGFDTDPAGSGNKPGLGLTSISERVRILGGTLQLESGHGRGTTITITIPSQIL